MQVQKVRILKASEGVLVGGEIRNEQPLRLPSMHNGWIFNFDKLAQRLRYATAYVLVCDDSPITFEGCLIFQMKDNKIPYMAYVEVAPHNKVTHKRYEYVAGCLIAFAFKQSLIQGKNEYKGWLTFDVSEKNPEDQTKLMTLYSQKYGAKKVDETTMYIMDDDGHILIEKYLDRSDDIDENSL